MGGGDVSFTDVKIKTPDRKCNGGMWMTSCTRSVHGGFWEIWKSQLVELSPASEEDSWLSLVHCGLVSGAHLFWGRWKSQVYHSPYVKKPFNSKVIKSFVPELRSRKCFSCFRIPMFYVYMLWTFYVHFPYSCTGILHIYIWIFVEHHYSGTRFFGMTIY